MQNRSEVVTNYQMANEVWRLDATDVVAGIRNREFSCRDAVNSCLERLDAVNPQLNAVVESRPDEALAAADKADEAALEGKRYAYILEKQYRWESWAAPKGNDGQIDHNNAMTGDDLVEFVNGKLFPYLHGFKLKASGPNTIEYKIGEIFGEIKNKISSGYNLREIIAGPTYPMSGKRLIEPL